MGLGVGGVGSRPSLSPQPALETTPSLPLPPPPSDLPGEGDSAKAASARVSQEPAAIWSYDSKANALELVGAPETKAAPVVGTGSSAPLGSFKAGALAFQDQAKRAMNNARARDTTSMPEFALRKLLNSAELGLRLAERELKAGKENLANRGFVDRFLGPAETKTRVGELEQKILPKLREAKTEYENAKKTGASQTEVEAKLGRYAAVSQDAQKYIQSSLAKEVEELTGTADKLDSAAKVSRVVRDVSLGTAAALASGGTSLAVTGAVVAGGAVLKTASDEAAQRVEGKKSTTAEVATNLAKNTVGLTVDAAGGATLKVLGVAAQSGKIGATGFAAGAGATTAASGTAKRAANGEDVLDGRAILADSVTGALTAGVGSKLAPAAAGLGEGKRAALNGAVGAASAGGAQATANVIQGKSVGEGVTEAAIVGAGTGIVVGGVQANAPSKKAEAKGTTPPPSAPREQPSTPAEARRAWLEQQGVTNPEEYLAQNRRMADRAVAEAAANPALAKEFRETAKLARTLQRAVREPSANDLSEIELERYVGSARRSAAKSEETAKTAATPQQAAGLREAAARLRASADIAEASGQMPMKAEVQARLAAAESAREAAGATSSRGADQK